jgi:transposase
MQWKECSVMDELAVVAQLLDGEAMSEVCRAVGISRKTGYKIFERYKEHGLEALTDRSLFRSARPQFTVKVARCHDRGGGKAVTVHTEFV